MYRWHILDVLQLHKGSAQASLVINEVRRRVDDVLRDGDFELLSGEERWRNLLRQDRRAMADDGLIHKSRQHGLWELTVAGAKTSPVAVQV